VNAVKLEWRRDFDFIVVPILVVVLVSEEISLLPDLDRFILVCPLIME
jgi:hypothetical protein